MSTHPELYEEALREEEELAMSNDKPLDIYDDPNPPAWPNTRTPFNRWYTGLHAFVYALKHTFSPYSNPLGMKAKYVNVRIDTRNGNFLVFTEDAKGDCIRLTTPDELGLKYKSIRLSLNTLEEQQAIDKEPPDYSKLPQAEYVPPKADSFDQVSNLTTEDLMRILVKREDTPVNVKELISLMHLRTK